jgi:hypothetical protein
MPGSRSDFFKQRGILTHNAPPAILLKARSIISRLEAGMPYWQLHGKSLQSDRQVISIPVGSAWRILAHDRNGRVDARQVLSHSSYNHRLNSF